MRSILLLFLALPLFLPVLQAQFIVFGNLTQSEISPTSFRLQYSTNPSGTPVQTFIEYGLSPSLEMGGATNGQLTSSHDIVLSGLSPATFYYVRAGAINGTDTLRSVKTFYFSTASNSTGSIKVFFNRSIDNSVSNGTYPDLSNSPAAIQAELIKRIDSASTSIDCSIYNINISAIVTALTNAHNRGVRVRYIANDGTANTALSPAPPFNVIYVNSNALMHNKFMVIDPGSINESYVWTGSTNWTTNNVNTDPNNVVLIQDQALAKAYEIEFEEMWGSNTATPNLSNAKSGSQKADNTPHLFNIGGRLVECYFSPSDGVTNAIDRALQTADVDIEFALLSFTQLQLGNTIISRHQAGKYVKGLINNIGDQNTQYTPMQSAGVDVLHPNYSGRELHHKYAIVDANTPASNPLVITGSHNWSNNAEQSNDENTLIIHDVNIANWFLQEFSARYCESDAAPSNNCKVSPPISIDKIDRQSGFDAKLFPNPASGSSVFLTLEQEADLGSLQLEIFNALGQQVYNQTVDAQGLNFIQLEIPIAHISSALYLVKIGDKVLKLWRE